LRITTSSSWKICYWVTFSIQNQN